MNDVTLNIKSNPAVGIADGSEVNTMGVAYLWQRYCSILPARATQSHSPVIRKSWVTPHYYV